MARRGERLDNINWLGEANGKLFFEGKMGGDRYFIDDFGSLRFKHREPAKDLVFAGGKFYYVMDGKEKIDCSVINARGEKGPRYLNVRDIQDINGELYYIGDHGNHDALVSPIGEVLESIQIEKLLNIGGRAYCLVAQEDAKCFIVGPGGRELRDFGENVLEFNVKDGFVHVVAKKDGKWIHYSLEIEKFANGETSPQETKPFDELNDLTEEEGRRLILLRAIASKDKGNVTAYREMYIDPKEKEKKPPVSKRVIGTFNRALKEGKKFLLGTVAAKREGKREAQMLAEYLFPELRAKRLRDRGEDGFGFGSRPEDYFALGSESELGDGDPLEEGKEVMRTREPIHELIVTQILAHYRKDGGVFENAAVPVEPELGEPTHEYTFSINDVYGLHQVSLPFLLGAEIIPERVKGIMADGREVPLTPEILPTGGARVTLPPQTKGLVYSLRRSELPAVPEALREKEYDAFRRDLGRRYGTQYTEKIAPLPSELKLFVASLDKLAPHEKIIAIEREVRRIGYYDFENRDVQREKRGLPLNDLFSFMRERMDVLKARKSDMPEMFHKKLYAGVCVDFNKLVLAMLREAGIPSGLLTGFRPTSEVVTTANAHGTAFALWPAEKSDKYRLISIDGTPGGVTDAEQTLLANIQQPSLEEKQKDREKIAERWLEEATARFAEVEALLKTHDVDAIKKLSNGELETIVNTILRYGVKESHYRAIQGVLNASQYSPFNVSRMDLEHPAQRREFHAYVTREIERERAWHTGESTPAGGALFSAIEDFVGRNGPNAYRTLERIFDVMEPELDPIEARAFIATVKYLEAKKMRS